MSKINCKSVQEYIKVIHHDQIGFIAEMQKWLNIYKTIRVVWNLERSMERNYMFISVRCIKSIWESPTPMIKASTESRKKRIILQHNKGWDDESIANIILNGKKDLKLFPVKSGIRKLPNPLILISMGSKY